MDDASGFVHIMRQWQTVVHPGRGKGDSVPVWSRQRQYHIKLTLAMACMVKKCRCSHGCEGDCYIAAECDLCTVNDCDKNECKMHTDVVNEL